MAATSEAVRNLRLYGAAVARVLTRTRREGGSDVAGATERPVFVLGSPRSGTSFVARSIGGVPGFADLGELPPWKAAIPRLALLPEETAAGELRRMLESIRRFGLVRRLRAVEQSPETAFVLPAVLRAYPQAAVVHMVRDPRDVAASLVQKGWLRAGRSGRDDVGEPYGHHPRFWVEPERREEFAAERESVSEPLAVHIGADPVLLAEALGGMHAESVGRWRRNLTSQQVAEVKAEAGELMQELGYS